MIKKSILFLVIEFLLISPFDAQEVIVHATASFAAKELQQHLEKICGRSLPIVPEKEFKGMRFVCWTCLAQLNLKLAIACL